ncbi:MAG: hydrogen gas-evolving membrane-bound hydrogenase subunit E [Ilumatobacteraceae bacterium]
MSGFAMAFTASLLAHFLVGALALTAMRRRPVLLAWLGVAVFIATVVVTWRMGGGAESTFSVSYDWISPLGLGVNFRLDGFAMFMIGVVAVLGALVLAYSTAYFPDDPGYARFVGLFMVFAGAMTGLVASADLFTMFIFWELTSVCSFLLIGLNDGSAAARTSAVRALLTTGLGGLCLLAGVVVLQVEFGTTRFTDLAAVADTGGALNAVVILVLLGAFTKSAQMPFSFWLPGAMAAPTPVSAYLHSATMVKAGIVLIARLAPILSDVFVWRWWVVIAGSLTMLVGGINAMRQTDAKLLLAHSTVSQLGFLTLLVGIGTTTATYAGVAHLFAHAVFKAALFLGVGVIDHETGTRDISAMRNVARRLPVTATAMALAAASMAGVIPLLGFVTKEKALVALLKDNGAPGVVALVGVVVGSVLSVAYSVRLVRGIFARGVSTDHGVNHGAATHDPHHDEHHASLLARLSLQGPVVLLAAVSVIAGFLAGRVGGWLSGASRALDAEASYELVLWPGANTAFLVSVGVVVVGVIVGMRVPLRKFSSRSVGERAFDATYDATISGSKRLTAVTQSGSLPAYVAAVIAVVGAAVVTALVRGATVTGAGGGGDGLLRVLVVALTIVMAVALLVVPYRFTAALLLGGVGFGVAVLFVGYGAPDLALTQLLIETLTIIVFLLALRAMPQRFAASSRWAPTSVRLVISGIVGVAVPLFAAAVVAARRAPSVAGEFLALSEPQAGGRNVVNVILVDFRGFDTLGEITVLVVAALGVANLVRMALRHKDDVEAGRKS